MTVDDTGDWQRAQGGDQAAFSAVFERYADAVYNLAFRRTASWAVAEDIVGTTFLELWRQRGRVELHNGSLRPWLFAVASNQAARSWRTAHRRATAEASTLCAGSETGTDTFADADARLDAEGRAAAVLLHLEQLPGHQREVLQLWAWEQLTYEEISAALRVPVGTVRSRLNRARQRLVRLNTIEGTPANLEGRST